MTAREIQADLDCLDDLPPLPGVLLRLMRLLGKEGTSIDDVDEVVRQDPLLAARIVRLANSAAFGARFEARTTRDALMRLGTSEVQRLSLAMSAASAVPQRAAREDYAQFWQHSLSVARTAERISSRVRRFLPPDLTAETAFLAGLFHDIGELVLLTYYPTFLREVRAYAATNGLQQYEAEAHVLDTDHSALGVQVAAHWQLPDYVFGAILGHHQVERAAEQDRWYAALVCAADFFSVAAGLGGLDDAVSVTVDPGALDALGVSFLGLGADDVAAIAHGLAADARRSDILAA